MISSLDFVVKYIKLFTIYEKKQIVKIFELVIVVIKKSLNKSFVIISASFSYISDEFLNLKIIYN